MMGTRLAFSLLITAVLASFGGTALAAVFVPDPAGDTFGSGQVQHDILSVTSTINPANLVIDIGFAGAIAPASAFSASSLVGFLDLDVDQNSATGASTRFGAPPTPTIISGIEFYLDLFSESFSPGMVDIINASTGLPTGSAAISYGATSFSLTIPRSLIGNDDGFLNYGLVVGTFTEATDDARGSTGTSTPPGPDGVPEPTSLIAWALLSTIASAYVLRGRRKLIR